MCWKTMSRDPSAERKPVTEEQVYKNNVVNEIYTECQGKIKSLTLLRFIRDQRESRYLTKASLPGLPEINPNSFHRKMAIGSMSKSSRQQTSLLQQSSTPQ